MALTRMTRTCPFTCSVLQPGLPISSFAWRSTSPQAFCAAGAKSTKGLHVCRHLHRAGWRVVLVDVHRCAASTLAPLPVPSPLAAAVQGYRHAWLGHRGCPPGIRVTGRLLHEVRHVPISIKAPAAPLPGIGRVGRAGRRAWRRSGPTLCPTWTLWATWRCAACHCT